jgi:hypothetical protein
MDKSYPVMNDVRTVYDTDPTKPFVVADVQDSPDTSPYSAILYYIIDRTIPAPVQLDCHATNAMTVCAADEETLTIGGEPVFNSREWFDSIPEIPF